MGTSNFFKVNASKYYAVLMNVEDKYADCNSCDHREYDHEDDYCECSNCKSSDLEFHEETRGVDEWEIDDFIVNLQEMLDDYEEEDSWVNSRVRCIAYKSFYKPYRETEVGFTLQVCLNIGYYEGATLDFIIRDYEGGEMQDLTDLCEGLRIDLLSDWYFEDHEADLKRYHGWASAWCIDKFTEEVEKLEKVFEQISRPLVCTARFSNGEAFYADV